MLVHIPEKEKVGGVQACCGNLPDSESLNLASMYHCIWSLCLSTPTRLLCSHHAGAALKVTASLVSPQAASCTALLLLFSVRVGGDGGSKCPCSKCISFLHLITGKWNA